MKRGLEILILTLILGACGVKKNTAIIEYFENSISIDSLYYSSIIEYFNQNRFNVKGITIDAKGKRFIVIREHGSSNNITDKYPIDSSLVKYWRRYEGQSIFSINFEKRMVHFETYKIRNKGYEYPYLTYCYEGCNDYLKTQQSNYKILYNKEEINESDKSFIYYVNEHWLIVSP